MENPILYGDCNDILPTIANDSIDMILTDIPYGINYKSNKQNLDTRDTNPIKKNKKEYFRQIHGDNNVPVDWLKDAHRVLKNNSAIYIFCHWSKWDILKPEVEKYFQCKNMIVMHKSNHGMGDLSGSYAPKHELLLFATKGRHELLFPNGRDKDVWNVPVRFSGARRRHSNEKPLSWLIPCIHNSTKKNDIILDPFAGSGSTGEAAAKCGRRYYLIDIDEDNYNTMTNRLGNMGPVIDFGK